MALAKHIHLTLKKIIKDGHVSILSGGLHLKNNTPLHNIIKNILLAEKNFYRCELGRTYTCTTENIAL